MSLTMWMLASAAVAAGEEWGALEACAEGVGEACRLAAEAYLQGDLGEADLTTGLELYGRACELDSAEACLFLGDRLRQGVGVAPDLGLAAEWYGVACLLGAGDACRTVADYHVERSIPNANPDFASEWYTRGCDVGDAASCMNLVAVIEAGLPAGGALPVRALGFLGSACTSGMVDACTQLAHTLRVVKPLEAVGWIERGCELGHLPSCRGLRACARRGRPGKARPRGRRSLPVGGLRGG